MEAIWSNSVIIKFKGSETLKTTFSSKKIGEIKLWAWAATILPITALAAEFFFHWFGWENAIAQSLVIGATLFFAIAVYWWWWSLHTIAKVTNSLKLSAELVLEVKEEVNQIKTELKDIRDSTPDIKE